MTVVPTSRDKFQDWLDSSPFVRFLELACSECDAATGTLSLRMSIRPELERLPGTMQFHGGPVASLIDTVADLAVMVVTGQSVPTINFRVDYLRPSVGPYLVASARVRQAGRIIGVADVDVDVTSGIAHRNRPRVLLDTATVSGPAPVPITRSSI